MKIAFLFLTRKNHNSELCWNIFFKNIENKLYSIYCHPKNTPDQDFLKKNLVSNIIPTKWADISLVRATLILLSNAYKDLDNTHFILLSESCIPIVSFNYLYKSLSKNNNSCIHFKHLSNKLNRYQQLMYNIKNKLSFEHFYCQHQWMLLIRDDVKFFISRDLTSYFSKIPVSDEHYFISLIVLYKKNKNIINKKITYCNWENNISMHPKIYNYLTPKQLFQLQNDGFYFMRKISKDFKLNRFLINALSSY